MKILIAEDERVSRLYLADALQDWGYEVVAVADGDSACEILRRPDAPMLAIIDWSMPGMDGVDVCRVIRDTVKDRYVYLIILTSRSETRDIVEAMNAGADDFIRKPFDLDEMRVRVRAGRRVAELERELRMTAARDALTGLYNRGAIFDILRKEMARQEREGMPLSLMLADLDHFKQVNDRYGHLAGDAVLREVAQRISAVLRPYDALGRYGGEELLVVLPACNARGAAEAAERIRESVAASAIATEEGSIAASISIGVVVAAAGKAWSCNDLIRTADNALYRAKENGRNRFDVALAVQPR
jgi:two-component system cell cycle response regulator